MVDRSSIKQRYIKRKKSDAHTLILCMTPWITLQTIIPTNRI